MLPLLNILFAMWSLPASAMHVIVDPGHGGIDKGAVHGPAKESELVLKVAKNLQALLEKNPQFKVTMTRNLNTSLSLANRVALAEQSKADIFVSLHANAAADPRAKGLEFFFQNYLPPDEEMLYLARQENEIYAKNKTDKSQPESEMSKKSDITAILEDLKRQDRIESSLRLSQTLDQTWNTENGAPQTIIKQAPFYVLARTTMPAVLIEIGFLTNPLEAKKLLSPAYQKGIAEKIYSALLSYKEKMDNSTAKTLN